VFRNNGDPGLPVDFLRVEPRLSSVLIMGYYCIGRCDYRGCDLNIIFGGDASFDMVWRF